MRQIILGLELAIIFFGYGHGEAAAGAKEEPSFREKPLSEWIADLKDSNPKVREEATVALAEIGPDAKPAIPNLIETLKDEEFVVRFDAAGALGKIGPATVPVLIDILKKAKPRRKGPKASGLRPLTRGPESYESCAREGAALALGLIGPAAKDAVPVLTTTLNDEDAGVRIQAAEALGKIGPAAKSARPALVEATKDEEWVVRMIAAEALKQIDREGAANTGCR